MGITSRSLWTLVHGMGFGALYLLACSGALVEFYRRFIARTGTIITSDSRFLKIYLFAMTLFAWFAVLTGTYIVYPWYRATPPPDTADLSGYPQKFLMSHAATIGWHSMGMEWKEHVAWLVPIMITMAAVVVAQCGSDLRNHRRLRTAVLVVVLFSFVSAGLAGFLWSHDQQICPRYRRNNPDADERRNTMINSVTSEEPGINRLPNGAGAAGLLSA